ncbi:MAG: DUF3330 domain-containing protein [Thiohalomonadales bacterium]
MRSKHNMKMKALISCDICMKEVPCGECKVSEVDDYVMHFCGLECYDKWHKQADKEKITEG